MMTPHVLEGTYRVYFKAMDPEEGKVLASGFQRRMRQAAYDGVLVTDIQFDGEVSPVRCSRDTNGDGDCGRPLCPECGRAHPKSGPGEQLELL